MASRPHTGSAGYSRDTVIPEGHQSAGARAAQNVAESPREMDGDKGTRNTHSAIPLIESAKHPSLFRGAVNDVSPQGKPGNDPNKK